VIYNGISLDRFAEKKDASSKHLELGLSPDSLVVGSVGRLRQEKGYSILLDAAVLVRARRPDIKFVIVGDGEQAASLRQKAGRLGLSSTVLFTGARQDVESLLGIMDLFVLPSLWEGLPTVILESMACGVPVVATDIPGTRELITTGQTGWLARPGDPMSLAACILEALSNPARCAEIVKTARQDVVPHFSMQHIADQYEQIYQRLAGV
jgi:glycosyltransferase involved in cell wall biosynthesis